MTNQIWENYWSKEDNHEWWETPAPEVLQLIRSQSPSIRPYVLDIGCGLGRHTIAFAMAGFHVTATDSSDTAILHVQEWTDRVGVQVVTKVCTMTDQGFQEHSFDIVLAYNVIYHGYREQLAHAIAHISYLLKPGGIFFFTCPSRWDAKYGQGEYVAPHTYLSPNSVIPGDMHYFPDEKEFKELLKGFSIISKEKDEGYWNNRGCSQFYSNWQITAEKL